MSASCTRLSPTPNRTRMSKRTHSAPYLQHTIEYLRAMDWILITTKSTCASCFVWEGRRRQAKRSTKALNHCLRSWESRSRSILRKTRSRTSREVLMRPLITARVWRHGQRRVATQALAQGALLTTPWPAWKESEWQPTEHDPHLVHPSPGPIVIRSHHSRIDRLQEPPPGRRKDLAVARCQVKAQLSQREAG